MLIAVLIGSIYALAQFAANSEFTIMRAASMSSWKAAIDFDAHRRDLYRHNCVRVREIVATQDRKARNR